ncbi:hypothetical protein EJ04DRAFT_243901 [Polyplosphaeria fusca]|uniref:Uncharacterized protein n=1 Tax=Polyplosphaeria fusca TaxID=682080 RepID=A0A9P4V1J8_9PLEO|nr:hypothetical protein EJ04DRAFT_243901 [Polyplosphaeria fusca]
MCERSMRYAILKRACPWPCFSSSCRCSARRFQCTASRVPACLPRHVGLCPHHPTALYPSLPAANHGSPAHPKPMASLLKHLAGHWWEPSDSTFHQSWRSCVSLRSPTIGPTLR